MAKASKKQADRIKDFNSISEYKAATAKEGDVDTPVFDGHLVRRVIHQGTPWFSVLDVIAALEISDNPNSYWGKLKERMDDEGAQEVLTKCQKLKLPGKDGKMYPTDCASIETLNRIVQSIPSPKVETWKRWLAQVGFERIQETAEPSRAIERGISEYRKKRYDEAWINDRLKNISAYNEKTANWGARGVEDSRQFAKLNAEMTKEAFGLLPAEHAQLKGVKQSKRKDYMTRMELQIDTLADTAAIEIMEARDTQNFKATRKASLDGAGVAAAARQALEKQTGKPVVTRENALPKLSSNVLPSKKKPSTDEMLAWFRSEHGSAVDRSPWDGGEGGYQFPTEDDIAGVLEGQFPSASGKQIEQVVEELEAEGPWLTREFTAAMDEDYMDEPD